MRCLAVVVLAGCSFTHGGRAPTSDAPDAEVAADGAGDAAHTNCYAQWLDHTVRLQTPVAVAEVNSTTYDRDPFVTPDELTIYLSSQRVGSAGTDIWVATRGSLAEPFSNPTLALAFNSADSESKLSLTRNGLTAVVGSNRPTTAGGIDVWESTRNAASDVFPAMTRTKVMMVETVANEHDPTISADGLDLYLAPDVPYQHIMMASRTTPGGTFGMPAPITQLDTGTGDADPSPTPDERILLFSSQRALTGALQGNLWYATRANASATFDAPLPVPDVNSDAADGDPHMSADGCRVYFARYSGNGLDWDIYVATVL